MIAICICLQFVKIKVGIKIIRLKVAKFIRIAIKSIM